MYNGIRDNKRTQGQLRPLNIRLCRYSALFLLSLLLNVHLSHAQTIEEKRFLDTLKLRGAYLIGREMHPFSVISSNGIRYSNRDLPNKVTLINFWFEDCPPCIAEMNALEELYMKYKNENSFQFISFTFESKPIIDKIRSKFGITFPILSTSTDSCYYLNFKNGFPTTIIVGPDNKIAYFVLGGSPDPSLASIGIKMNAYPVIDSLLKHN